MTRFKLTVEYDGRPYVGWQRQQNGPSVQEALERACTGFAGHEVSVQGAGRTDTGVHATGQIAHIDLDRPMTADKVMAAINAHLRNEAVAVVKAERVADDFHARFDAIERRYRYVIVNRRAKLTFEKGLAWQVRHDLDTEAMNGAAQVLVGKHDFTTFRSVQCQSESPVKTLDRLAVTRQGDQVIIEAVARSFLHRQVRSLVGTLVEVGLGRWTGAVVRTALQAADRAACGPVAPPDGLYLEAVRYPPALKDTPVRLDLGQAMMALEDGEQG